MPLRSLLVLLLVIALCVPGAPPALAAPAIEGLTGTVREADGTPAAGVQVWLVRTWQEGAGPIVKTDQMGRYALPAAAGEYIEAVFTVTDLTKGPTGYRHAIRRGIAQFNVVIPAAATRTLDVVLPDVSVTGACTMTGCTIDLSATGFGPGEILAVTLVADIRVGDHTFSQRLATLGANAEGASRGTFVVDGLARANYGIHVANGPHEYAAQVKHAETAKTLSVGPPPCTDPPCEWRAWSFRLGARASLVLSASDRAIATLTASSPAARVKVGGRITAGPGCGDDAELIATFPGWTATAAGERSQRLAIRGASLDRLRAIERAGTPLWFKFALGTRWSCMRLWRWG